MSDGTRPLAPEALAAQLRRLEEELHTACARTSARCSQLLADEFIEFGSSGRIYGKADVIAAWQDEAPAGISVEEFRIEPLAPGVVLVAYRALRRGRPPVLSLRSSIWRQQGDQWRMLFHQGTSVSSTGD